MIIQPEFEDLVRTTDEICRTRFDRRMAAMYLAGSVAVGEAWCGASDLDWFVILHREPTPADKTWQRRTQRRLEQRFPAAAEVHVNLYSLARLRREAFWRFILRYNAARMGGSNVIAELSRAGAPTPRPSRALARSRVPFVRQCLSEALAGRCPPALAALPADPYLASRKLARNFVIVEGAFVLMCQRRFDSFKQEAVLHGLRRVSRRWRRLLTMTDAILTDPYHACVKPDDLMAEVEPFIEWGISLAEGS